MHPELLFAPSGCQAITSADDLTDSILGDQDSKTKLQIQGQQPKAVNLSSVATTSEIEGVRRKIRPCFGFPARSKLGPVVALIVSMNGDGTPVKAEIKETGRYNNDPVFRATADSALRAIMNPRCQPWPLSEEKYNSWRVVTIYFDPSNS